MSIFARSFQSHSSPVIQITLALYFCCWKACRSQLGLSSINKNQFLSSQENEALPNTEAVWSWSCSWLCMVLFITEVCWRLIGSIKRKQTDCLRKLVSDYNSSDTLISVSSRCTISFVASLVSTEPEDFHFGLAVVKLLLVTDWFGRWFFRSTIKIVWTIKLFEKMRQQNKAFVFPSHLCVR